MTTNLIDYDYAAGGFWPRFCLCFNALEAAAWFAIGAWVFARYLRNRKSPLEILYAVLFVAFGLTDIREIASLPVWLLLLKAIILAAIVAIRGNLKRHHYPTLRL